MSIIHDAIKKSQYKKNNLYSLPKFLTYKKLSLIIKISLLILSILSILTITTYFISSSISSKKIYKNIHGLDFTNNIYQNIIKREEKIKLDGILISDLGNNAIINNKILTEGDKVNDLTIKKINERKVILSNGQKTIELSN